jgi:hypothetical protein
MILKNYISFEEHKKNMKKTSSITLAQMFPKFRQILSVHLLNGLKQKLRWGQECIVKVLGLKSHVFSKSHNHTI